MEVSVNTVVIEALSLYPFQLLLYVPKSISTSFERWFAIFPAILFLRIVPEWSESPTFKIIISFLLPELITVLLYILWLFPLAIIPPARQFQATLWCIKPLTPSAVPLWSNLAPYFSVSCSQLYRHIAPSCSDSVIWIIEPSLCKWPVS